MRRRLLRLGAEPRVRLAAEGIAWTGGGFLLSAASLAASPMPLTMGLICSSDGWLALAAAAGSAAGYLLFWPRSGEILLWIAAALTISTLQRWQV
jgi:hypothetical protein